MAINSAREKIIKYWVDKFKSGSDNRTRSFKTVKRLTPDIDDLENYSASQLPLLAIVAGLPVPVPTKSGRQLPARRVFLSNLEIDFVVYAMDNKTPDSTLSDLADDLWVTLYGDPTSGDLGLELEVSPEPIVGVWEPYVVFKMTCDIKYKHTIGGI